MLTKTRQKESRPDFVIQKAARNVYVVGDQYVVLKFNSLECGCSQYRKTGTCVHTQALEAILCHPSNRSMHP